MRRQYAGARWSGQFTARGVTAPESVALSKIVGYNLVGETIMGNGPALARWQRAFLAQNDLVR
jgi:hypothetical protein